MGSTSPLRILSLGMAQEMSARCTTHADFLQMGAGFAAYRVFLSWKKSWRSSVTAMASTGCLDHVNALT